MWGAVFIYIVKFTMGFEMYPRHIMTLRLNQLDKNDITRAREFLKRENIKCLGWKEPESYRIMNPHIPWTPEIPYYYVFLNVNDTVVDVEFIVKTVTTHRVCMSLPNYADEIVKEIESYTNEHGGNMTFVSLRNNGLDNWYLEFMWRIPYFYWN
tara:strand:- start:1138 stop:1599 length:462 start_codon:yes stop_codon:yes gene_type:complete